MTKDERIGEIFNILIQFEKLERGDIEVQDYSNMLDRLCVWYLGYGNEEIYCGLKGLLTLKNEAEKETVRRTVFHMIRLLEQGG